MVICRECQTDRKTSVELKLFKNEIVSNGALSNSNVTALRP